MFNFIQPEVFRLNDRYVVKEEITRERAIAYFALHTLGKPDPFLHAVDMDLYHGSPVITPKPAVPIGAEAAAASLVVHHHFAA